MLIVITKKEYCHTTVKRPDQITYFVPPLPPPMSFSIRKPSHLSNTSSNLGSGKNIPRDLVTWNFLNLNESWEFVKMCETSPKVNRGKFLKALVSHHNGHRHWTYNKVAKTTKSGEIEDKLEGYWSGVLTNNKDKQEKTKTQGVQS